MKIKVKTKELKNAISIVGKVMPNPSEKNMLVRLNENLTLITTNLEQAIEYSLSVENSANENAELLFPFNEFRDIVKKIKEETLDIETFEKRVVLKDANGDYSLDTKNPDLFPTIPEVDASINLSFKFDELREFIKNVTFAVSKKEESRREFKGVWLDINEDYVNFVGTDAQALALSSGRNIGLPKANLIIPWKAFDILEHLPYKDERVNIIASETNIQFKLPNLKITSFLINGQIPNYMSVIPKETEFYAKVSKKELVDALDIVGMLAKKGTGRIVFAFASNKLTIEPVSSDVSFGRRGIACETNANMSLYFPVKIIEGIKHIQSDVVYFGIQSASEPVLIKGTESDNYIYVIMPQEPM